MDHLITPLFNAIYEHYKRQPISLHVPGHKSGTVFIDGKEDFYSQIFKIDVTELSGLDDLHSPQGAILEAENMLAYLYRVKKSYLLVNGSTVGNLAMIMSIGKEYDKILVQRNCHKSVLNGIQLGKLTPVFLTPTQITDWGVAGGLSLDIVKEAIQMHPDAKAIIVTYPNYYGMVNELKEIITYAHSYQIPVLVDEAHGAHLIADEFFPPSATQLGADIVVQSAHKTLPAMTMGSFLHFNSEFIEKEKVTFFLHVLQSSSPSYPIMASLDLARSYLGTYTKEDFQYLVSVLQRFKDELQLINGIRLLEYPNGAGDLLKITIQSTTNLTGYELQQSFENVGIYSELADPHNVLFVLPLLKNGVSYPFDEIIKKIKMCVSHHPKVAKRRFNGIMEPKISTLAISQEQQQGLKHETLLLADSVNKICAESIIPYPPGIPMLLPGEEITAGHIKNLKSLLESGARFQGDHNLVKGKIKVYKRP